MIAPATMRESELLALYRDGTAEEREAARRELDARRRTRRGEAPAIVHRFRRAFAGVDAKTRAAGDDR